MNALRLSTPKEEGVMHASKWLTAAALLDAEEMRALFVHLGDFSIFVGSQPVSVEEGVLTRDAFLDLYAAYVEKVQQGVVVPPGPFRRAFSSFFTTESDLLYAFPVGGQRFLIKAIRPVLQLQAHHFYVSKVDAQVYSMVLSEQSVTWGIQFSYPALYQDPKTHQMIKTTGGDPLPNAALFFRLMQWMRRETVPLSLSFQGVRRNLSMRLGKKCLPWIAHHAQLGKQGVEVCT